jgi:hypothetical protein
MLALEIVKYAYLATLICVVLIELFPNRRFTRPAALAAIFLVTVGGSAWAYAAYHTPGTWPEFDYDKQAKADGAASDRGGARRGGDGHSGAAGEAAGDAGEGDLDEAGGGAGSGTAGASGGAGSAVVAAGNSAAYMTETAARSLAVALGLASEPEPKPAAGDAVQDCSDCPQMVIVPAGRARIGASDDDPMSTPAER